MSVEVGDYFNHYLSLIACFQDVIDRRDVLVETGVHNTAPDGFYSSGVRRNRIHETTCTMSSFIVEYSRWATKSELRLADVVYG